MTSISLADPANHTLADATLIQSNNALIEGVINGNLDNGNVVAGANIDGAKLADGTVINSKLVQSGGVLANMPPGRELTYNEFTADVVVVATTEAAATTVATASAFTFDGTTAVIIEFFCPGFDTVAIADNDWSLWLYDGASSIGRLGFGNIHGANSSVPHTGGPITLRRRLAPSAAAHTYSIRASAFSASGVTLHAGSGGATFYLPGYIRITKV